MGSFPHKEEQNRGFARGVSPQIWHRYLIYFKSRSPNNKAWAGLEEPFAILHKVTLYAIREERDKEAAARKTTYVRRTAADNYTRTRK